MREPLLGWLLFGFYVVLRTAELPWARANTRRLLRHGGRVHDGDMSPVLIGLHVLTFTGIGIERLLGARLGGPVSWAAGLLMAVALLGRFWTLGTLGRRWTIRVVTVPGETAVRQGPYRWVRHPNYVVLLVEILCLPALFHAWWTLVIGTIPHVVALLVRIRVEEAAWRESVLRTAATP
jgi:methyltransferase